MTPKKKSLADSRLYLILDKGACHRRPMAAILEKALAGGADIIQWRDKISTTRVAIKETRSLLKICRRHNVPFIVNDRLDIALAISPDGIHLGQEDLPPLTARRIFGHSFLIGLSCQHVLEIKNASREAIDYFGFGPVFPTITKKTGRPLGAYAYKQALRATQRPVFAIGGINEKNLEKIIDEKTRICVCRVICRAKDISKTTKFLKEKLIAMTPKIRD